MRHTITITVTETWTITWQDGRETVWAETSTRVWPDDAEPVLPLRDEKENGMVDPDAADSVTGAE
jgi:hypothetical protein